jgi:eukaryotic-like serine/threonine-protein kinase
LQLGRYQVLKHLASGSIADVLLARASGLEGFARHVVIKRMKPELAKEERFAKAFLDEARISASLNHQNIVQVHDIGEEGGSYFFAMEYIHGEDVRTLLAKVRERGEHVPLEIAVAIIMSAAAGLHHAHEKTSSQGEKLGIVHRDVSPSNVLVGYDGSVKLVDFGLAKAAQRSTTTASGTLKGKASYMSPEQCKGEPVDRRTDTFCLGILLYELVTAQRLFKGPTEYATMAAVVDGDIPPPSRLRADIPTALDAIILRALARNKNERYQTAEDLRAAVEAFAVEYQLRTSNKALSDYLIRLFGHRAEPWETAEDRRPVTDETMDGSLRGAAVAPPIMPAPKPTPKPAPAAKPAAAAQAQEVEDDEDDDEFGEDEVKTTLMRDDDKLAIEAQARIDEARAKQRAQSENEEFSRTIVEPPAFEAESETEVETPAKNAPKDPKDLQKPLGKKPVNRQQADTEPNSTPRGPAPRPTPPSKPPAPNAPTISGKTPPGAFQPPAAARTGNTPPGAHSPGASQATKTGNTPPGAFTHGAQPTARTGNTPPGAQPQGMQPQQPPGFQQPFGQQPFGQQPPYQYPQGSAPPYGSPYPVAQGGVYPGQQSTMLGVGAPSPSVFSQYSGAVPADYSLSKFAGFKKWFALYRRSIVLGGGMGVGVVILMVIIMRACGGSTPAALPDAPPPDAPAEVKQAPPVDAAVPPDAPPKKKKGSSSAAH